MQIEKRGTYTVVEDYINPSITETRHPYKFDVKNAPELLLKALVDGKNITIVGDYDCDGICASAISLTGFRQLKKQLVQYKNDPQNMPNNIRAHLIKFAQNIYQCDENTAKEKLSQNHAESSKVLVRIPHRYTEGYGMKESIVDEIHSGVLFTVDNGIAASAAVKRANEKGLTTIVTDHHAVPVTKTLTLIDGEMKDNTEYHVPPADCLINPHVEETFGQDGHYDFYDYCGAGVALKIVESVLSPEDQIIDQLYAFAAIATVADVMPMIEDNRNIFSRGVDAMRNGNVTTGLAALLASKNIKPEYLPEDMPSHAMFSSDLMGFQLGPMINAPGRVGTKNPASENGNRGADRSLRCLLATDPKQAQDLAEELNDANETRKEISKQMEMRADAIIAANHMEHACPLVVHIPECGDGVIGLVAGYLCEKYVVPAIVFNDAKEEGKCKGSARSPEGINIKELLDDCQSQIYAYGGHPGAAGLTIFKKVLDNLREMLYNDCVKKGISSLATDSVQYDLEIEAEDIPHNAEVLIKTIAPFGEGNPEPIFLVHNFQFKEAKQLNGIHLKLEGDGMEAIGFHLCEDKAIMDYLAERKNVDLLGTVSYNCFRGQAKPQLSIQYIVDGIEIIRDDMEHIVPEIQEEEEIEV